MDDIHKIAFPVTAGQKEEKITTDTLDHALEKEHLQGNTLIKIDVQGFEDKVILGGKETIASAAIIIVETSFVELYKNQPLFDTVYQLLYELGFRYAGVWAPELTSPLDGRRLQQDSIFLRQDFYAPRPD